MPPKRKSGAKSTRSRASKRTKLSDDLDGFEIQWEWENDGGIWTAFQVEHSKSITTDCQQYKPKIALKLGGGAVNVEVLFNRMVQRNTKTGWERRVRATFKHTDGDNYYWEWKDDAGKWQQYQALDAVRLEKAFTGDEKSAEVEVVGQDYTFDFVKMTQTNNATDFSRDIRREKSDLKPAEKNGVKKVDKNETVKEESESEDEVLPTTSKRGGKSAAKKSAPKSTAKSSAKGKSASKTSETKSTIRKIVMKGAAPVDPECTEKVETAHVYSGTDKVVWDCMLNQTNLQFNNNKYYLIQLLEDDARKAYSVWMRWGRVGKKGQTSLAPFGSNIDQAKKIFSKKFQDKTKNGWPVVGAFEKVSGKYDLVHVDYSASNSEDTPDSGPKPAIEYPDSKLHVKVQALIQLICDVKSMEDAVVEMQYDTKKAPLGKLNPAQIKAGYAALKEISELLDDPAQASHHALLVQACNDFYTRIPHDFGMKVPPIIRTKQEVKQKIQLIEALSDIEIAMKLIKEGDTDTNPVDSHYNSLKCQLDLLNKTDSDYKMIEDYMSNTHAATHAHYRMKILDLFAVKKQGDENFMDVGNRKLLWHGSRLTNWMGILSQGLRIAPPEAPVTGYMFGKGVYFADMSSKSANYCFTTKTKNVGLVLLSEVSLGNVNKLLNADYNADRLPAGKHSVQGVGAIAPDPSKSFTMSDGTQVPIGKSKNTGVKNPSGYTLNYNEFIVYNTRQVRMRYLVKVQFDYK